MARFLKKLIPKPVKDAIRREAAPAPEVPSEYRVLADERNRLEGMRVVVTGATGAIGSLTVHRLLVEGAVVGACGRSREKLETPCGELEREGLAQGGRLVPVKFDVTDDDSVRDGIASFVLVAGSIDALVNNAGGVRRATGARHSRKRDFSVSERAIEVNLRGSMLCAYEVVRLLVEQGTGGRIVNMSSVIGTAGARGACDYAAAKAGIIGFTKSLAIELGGRRHYGQLHFTWYG